MMRIDFKTVVDHCCNVVKNQYFCFDGRVGREAYWMYMIPALILSCLPVIGQVIALVLLCPSLGMGARRLHDIGKSGWLQLIVVIPLIGVLILLYWFCQPGTREPNCYEDADVE